MKSVNLPRMSAVKPKFRYRKNFENQQLPNILGQQFFTEQPNRKWTSDMTFIKTITVNVYLDIIIDAFSRKIINWKISPRMTSQFIVELISDALRKRKTSPNLILHTDRGSQYTSHAVRQFLYPNQINHSFSKIGYPWDNAITESFFKYTRKEELNRRKFHDIPEVRKAAFNYYRRFLQYTQATFRKQIYVSKSKGIRILHSITT